MRRVVLTLSLFMALVSPALAVNPGEALSDPALEARARTISKELRCLVCQNQSIDDSDADLAGDLRKLVRDRLVAGDSDEQVLDYIVARYGDFVLLRPPFDVTTALLWLTPFGVVVFGGVGLWLAFRRRSVTRAPQALDSEEKSKLAALLNETTPRD
ncbi:MAG: cytochrome c-type biogenesis protein CcmH [Parvibaculum sp.]|nr:cytochrome c-type biogenesis protein CcmH [Parvibaculum sp.]